MQKTCTCCCKNNATVFNKTVSPMTGLRAATVGRTDSTNCSDFVSKPIRFSVEALTGSLFPIQLDQRSLWCEKSQNASDSMRSYSSHLLPRGSPRTPAHCPIVCTPAQWRRHTLKTCLFIYLVYLSCHASSGSRVVHDTKYWPQTATSTNNQNLKKTMHFGRVAWCGQEAGAHFYSLGPKIW